MVLLRGDVLVLRSFFFEGLFGGFMGFLVLVFGFFL